MGAPDELASVYLLSLSSSLYPRLLSPFVINSAIVSVVIARAFEPWELFCDQADARFNGDQIREGNFRAKVNKEAAVVRITRLVLAGGSPIKLDQLKMTTPRAVNDY